MTTDELNALCVQHHRTLLETMCLPEEEIERLCDETGYRRMTVCWTRDELPTDGIHCIDEVRLAVFRLWVAVITKQIWDTEGLNAAMLWKLQNGGVQ